MDQLEILTWIVIAGFVLLFCLILLMWRTLGKGMCGNRKELKDTFIRLEEQMMDIDRRLCKLEGAFFSKDSCISKEIEQQQK